MGIRDTRISETGEIFEFKPTGKLRFEVPEGTSTCAPVLAQEFEKLKWYCGKIVGRETVWQPVPTVVVKA